MRRMAAAQDGFSPNATQICRGHDATTSDKAIQLTPKACRAKGTKAKSCATTTRLIHTHCAQGPGDEHGGLLSMVQRTQLHKHIIWHACDTSLRLLKLLGLCEKGRGIEGESGKHTTMPSWKREGPMHVGISLDQQRTRGFPRPTKRQVTVHSCEGG